MKLRKNELEIVNKHISLQQHAYYIDGKKIKQLRIEEPYASQQKLSDKEIIELTILGKTLEQHTYFPQEAQWAIEKDQIYFTSVKELIVINANEKKVTTSSFTPLQGAATSPGIATGPVQILRNAQEEIKSGEIVVASEPKIIPLTAMKNAAAIVTDTPMQTSHATSIYKQFGIPIVSETLNASATFKSGDTITVNGSKGHVYKGGLHATHNGTTAIKVFSLTSSKKQAPMLVNAYVDGIVFDASLLVAGLGIHPRKLVKNGKGKQLTQTIVKELLEYEKLFPSHAIIYKFSDVLSSDYRLLPGGNEHELFEANPLLGYHGAFRHVHDSETFIYEINAIKELVTKKHNKNISILLPFIRSTKELEQIQQHLSDAGIKRSHTCKFYLEVATPANVLSLEDMIQTSIDGVMINYKYLTSLTLGADQDNGEVALAFTPHNNAVINILHMAITTAQKHNIPVSLLSNIIDGNTLQNLVQWGIDSVVVSPKAVAETKELLVYYEHKLTTYGKDSTH